MPFLSLCSRGLVEAKRQEARERKGCSGHSILRVGSGSEGWVSWEWWPQKSTEWVTEIRELVFPKTCPCMDQVCSGAQVEMTIYRSRLEQGLVQHDSTCVLISTRGHKLPWGLAIPLKEGELFCSPVLDPNVKAIM